MKEIGISIITPTIRKECVQNIIDNFLRQDYKNKEMIIVINKDELNRADYIGKDKNIYVYQLSETDSLSECLNFAIQKCHYEYIARFDDDDYYGASYLAEVNECFQTKNCQIVNKGSFYCYFKEKHTLILRGIGKEEHYRLEGGGATICFEKKIYEQVQFKNQVHEDSIFMDECRKQGYIIYSSSPYHFLVLRSIDPLNHTFKRDYEFFLQSPRMQIISEQITLEEAYQIADHYLENKVKA